MARDETSFIRRVLAGLFGRGRKDEETANLDHLTGLVRRFAVEQQQVPKTLGELVTLKYLEALPVAPSGQKFLLDRKMVEVRLVPAGSHTVESSAGAGSSLTGSAIATKPSQDPA